MPRPTATRRHAAPRPRRRAPQPPNLFELSSAPEEESLRDDLAALVALGLLEERSTPEGVVFALTELGRRVPPS